MALQARVPKRCNGFLKEKVELAIERDFYNIVKNRMHCYGISSADKRRLRTFYRQIGVL